MNAQVQAIGLALIVAIGIGTASSWNTQAAARRTAAILAADARNFQIGVDRYVAANPAALASATLTGPVLVTGATLVAGGFLTPEAVLPTLQGATKAGCVYRDSSGQVTSMSTAFGGTPLRTAGAISTVVDIGYPGFYVAPDGVTLSGAGRTTSAAPCNSVIAFAANQVVTGPVLDAAAQPTATFLSRFDVPGHPEETTMSADLKGGGFDAREFRDVLVDRDVLAAGDVVAVGYVQPRLVKAAGDACNASGTVNDVGGLAQDANGKPLYCDLATASFQTAGGGGGGTFRVWVSFHQQNFGTFCPNSICPAPCPPGASEIYPKHWDGSGLLYTTTYIPEAFGWMWEAERWCKLD